MISVVCVYNDAKALEERLLSSLSAQNTEHEILTVDNRDSVFHNAATALNWGASQAKGQLVVFAHQDVSLLSVDWLLRAETIFRQCSPAGWMGVAGSTDRGELRGFLRDRAALFGAPFDVPIEVQSLDECLLIHRRESGGYHYFDEAVPGWHAYGVEACCSAISSGKKNYVISLPIWHDSKSSNLDGLAESHAYVSRKHGSELREIFTTCGTIHHSYEMKSNRHSALFDSIYRRACASVLRMQGFDEAYLRWFGETLESLVGHIPVVECLHDSAPFDPIEAEAFVPQPELFRRIIHRFSGLEFDGLESKYVVVAPDLAAKLPDQSEPLGSIRKNIRQLLVCLNVDDAKKKPRLWRALFQQSVTRMLTLQLDGTRTAVFEIGLKSRLGPLYAIDIPTSEP
jgi:Glycosyltransferase like family